MRLRRRDLDPPVALEKVGANIALLNSQTTLVSLQFELKHAARVKIGHYFHAQHDGSATASGCFRLVYVDGISLYANAEVIASTMATPWFHVTDSGERVVFLPAGTHRVALVGYCTASNTWTMADNYVTATEV